MSPAIGPLCLASGRTYRSAALIVNSIPPAWSAFPCRHWPPWVVIWMVGAGIFNLPVRFGTATGPFEALIARASREPTCICWRASSAMSAIENGGLRPERQKWARFRQRNAQSSIVGFLLIAIARTGCLTSICNLAPNVSNSQCAAFPHGAGEGSDRSGLVRSDAELARRGAGPSAERARE